MSVGEVDLLVGIPSHNNAKSISQTVTTIEDCFQQNFVRDRVVIVNVDGGSRDGTSDVVLNTPSPKSSNGRGLSSLRTLHRITTGYANQPLRGTAFRTILAAADLLRAKACAVISPEISNFSAAWVKSLLQPAYRENWVHGAAPRSAAREAVAVMRRMRRSLIQSEPMPRGRNRMTPRRKTPSTSCQVLGR